MTVHDLGPEVARLLHRLDDTAPAPPSFDDIERRDEPIPDRRSRRVVAVAAAAVLVLGIGGLVSLQAVSEPSVDDVVTTQAGTVSATTAPPTSQPDATTVPSTAPPTTLPAPTPDGAVLPTFTRLMPTVLPEGYVLGRAIWERLGGIDIGYATFHEDASDVVIGVTIRAQANFFTHSGEPVTVVGDRPVYSGTESGTCDGGFCSLEVQWDDRTAVSVEWSSTSGQVEAGAKVDELVGIVQSLQPSADTWIHGSLEEQFAQDGACSALPVDVIPFVLAVAPDGYELTFAHFEESEDGAFSLARYDAAGGTEADGSSIYVIGRPTPMWPMTVERPVVRDTGPFVLRDSSEIEGGSDSFRSVGFEVAGRNYVTVDSDGPGVLSFDELGALADSLFAKCSAYEAGSLLPK